MPSGQNGPAPRILLFILLLSFQQRYSLLSIVERFGIYGSYISIAALNSLSALLLFPTLLFLPVRGIEALAVKFIAYVLRPRKR